jgi:hypothetical protein
MVSCAAVAGLFAARSSQAALILDYPGTGVVIPDNGPGDTNPALGTIVNTQFVGGFGITINIAQSNSPGNPGGGELQISDLSIHNVGPGPGSLDIRVSDTNFFAPGGAGSPMLLKSSAGGTFLHAAPLDSVRFISFADPANAQPAGPVATLPLVFNATGPAIDPESFSGDTSVPWVRGGGPYSLTNITRIISLAPGAQLNFSGTTLAQVPEPACVGLAAAGLVMAARRRRA